MSRLLAIIKREYVQRVRARMFVVATVLGPLIMLAFAVVPALIFSFNAGGPLRVAVLDETGRLYARVRDALQNGADEAAERGAAQPAGGAGARPAGGGAADFVVSPVVLPSGRAAEEAKAELDELVRRGTFDAYLVLPRDVLATGRAEMYVRNLGDEFTVRQVQERLGAALRDERLAAEGIDPARVRAAGGRVTLSARKIGAGGAAAGAGRGSFGLAFGIGFFIYLTILLYGQVILGAVVEEKATRLSELLFSAVKPFTLMMGKLLGVSLVALTQFAIWAGAFLLVTLYGAGALAAGRISLPPVAPSVVVYACLFFLMGYFLYATIYLLLGAMVQTAQEGGQLALPVVFMLVMSLYLAVPVIRSPTSPFAVWVSLVPFSAPITMVARIVAEPPPAWQIALSLAVGYGTVALLVWLAARVYRVGMLMYGKRASLPEVVRWARRG
ncbi:MAG TPA: ABC transporter permease [Pyrinomonadaceae bacterium]|jgi:ABC-2 type transport system permease protein